MSIYNHLYDWQQQIVDQFKDKRNFGLFLKMGLGKTPLSLALAEENGCDKILIVSINSKATEDEYVKGSFLDWANKADIRYEYITKSTKLKADNSKPQIFLINYEGLYIHRKKSEKKARCELKPEIIDFLNSCLNHKAAIIIDESHNMKNLQSIRTLALNKIKQMLKFRASSVYSYLLTGTPFTTGYIDLYSQLKFLGYDENKSEFIDQFCIRGNIPGLLGWQQPIVGYKNVKQLYRVIHRYAITIETNDVVKLPEQIFINHSLPISNEFILFTSERLLGKKIYNYMSSRVKLIEASERQCNEQEVSNRLNSYNHSKKFNNPFYRDILYDVTKEFPTSDFLAEETGTFWLRCRQLSIGFIGNSENCEWLHKNRLKELEKFLAANPDNYVLFYNFTPELLELYSLCEKLGYNIDVYCGEMKSLSFYEKYEAQDEAQRLTNNKNIILANFASGSTGKNWQAYSSCIIFSIPVYKDYMQGIARIHRLGQQNTVTYHTFYENNWLDEGMLKSLETRNDYNTKMFEADLQRLKYMLEGGK